MIQKKILSCLPQLKREIWIISYGRLISQIGHGLLIFSAPIYWVNLVGLSVTEMGIGLGLTSLAGILGRFFGGTLIDASPLNCRRTLLLSALISALSDGILTLTHNLPLFIFGSLLTGLGVGMSWPAISATIANLTTTKQYNEAFALTRLGERLGLNGGIFLGGLVIARVGVNNIETYRGLYLLDALTFILFFCLIYCFLPSTPHAFEKHPPFRGWTIALKDHRLMLFTVVAILVTTNISQIRSTLPLYLDNFLKLGESAQGASLTIANLFTWYISLTILSQLPLTRFLNRFSRLRALMLSMLLYGGGFILVWLAGSVPSLALIVAILALSLLAFALAAYDPLSSAFITDLAPPPLRGIYLSINSQSWAIGFAIGPLLGGWLLDHSGIGYPYFWLLPVASTGLAFLILIYLNRTYS